MWDNADLSGGSASRVRVALDPRQMLGIDSVENKSINLECGDDASTLALVDTPNVIASGN